MSFPPKIRQKLSLNTNRLTAILGENLDIGFGERNGAGKSAILDAILYLYFGKTFRVSSNQNLVNYIDPGALFVVGTARRDGTWFRVERGENPSILRLFEKPENDARDWYTKEDGKFLFEKTKSTKPETSKRVVELLGFDLKLSDVLIFNNPADKSCFFLKDEADQRNIIERIFGFTAFTEKANRLRELRKEENKNLTTKEAAFIATRQANDRVLREIEALEEKSTEWAASRDKAAHFLNHQINTYTGIDFQVELTRLAQAEERTRRLHEISRDIVSVEQAIRQTEHRRGQWQAKHDQDLIGLKSTLSVLQMGDPEADIQTINARKGLRDDLGALSAALQGKKASLAIHQTTREQEQSQRARVAKQIGQLEQQIAKLDDEKCPTCGQEWHGTQEHLLECVTAYEDQAAELAQIEIRITETEKLAAEVKSDIQALTAEVGRVGDEIQSLRKTTFQTIEEAAAVHVRLADLTKKQEQEEQAVNPHDEGLSQLNKQYEIALQEQQSEQKLVDATPKTFYVTLTEAREGLAKFDQIQQQFNDLLCAENPYRETIDNLRQNALKQVDETEIKELKKRIEHLSLLVDLFSDRDSPIRKEILNDYLPKLNEEVNNNLSKLELPHRVEFDSDMTATFMVQDHSLAFGNLSTGQRLRVWLATNKAFRDIFELINYPINLFFVDEVLDKGLSTRGAEVSYGFLQNMVKENKSIFLITHRQELADIADHTMAVVLENGLSTIVQ